MSDGPRAGVSGRGGGPRVAAGLAYFDQLGRERLCGHELKLAMTAVLGFRPTKAEINQVLGGGADDGMDRFEFGEVMARRVAARDSMNELRQLFHALDMHGRGFVTREDMHKVFLACPSVPPAVIDEVFDEADASRCGRLSFHQLERFLGVALARKGGRLV